VKAREGQCKPEITSIHAVFGGSDGRCQGMIAHKLHQDYTNKNACLEIYLK
jgi:hypothetical protein